MEWGNNPNTYVAIGMAIGVVWAAARWVGGVSQFNKSAKDTFDEIKRELRALRDRIDSILYPGHAPESIRGSRIILTDLGNKIADEVRANDLAEGLSGILSERAIGKNPYEIQELCFDYLENEYQPSAETRNLIQVCAFDNGVKEYNVRRVIALMTRDKLLEQATGN